MSSVSPLARARLLRGCLHQRCSEPLSGPAPNLSSTRESCRPNGFQLAGNAISAHVNCNAMIVRRPIPPPSGLCEPFGTHRVSVVERFSPIRF